jgi:hypothetical protein
MHSYALEHRECTAQKRRDKQSHSPDTLASAYSLVRRTKTLHREVIHAHSKRLEWWIERFSFNAYMLQQTDHRESFLNEFKRCKYIHCEVDGREAVTKKRQNWQKRLHLRWLRCFRLLSVFASWLSAYSRTTEIWELALSTLREIE